MPGIYRKPYHVLRAGEQYSKFSHSVPVQYLEENSTCLPEECLSRELSHTQFLFKNSWFIIQKKKSNTDWWQYISLGKCNSIYLSGDQSCGDFSSLFPQAFPFNIQSNAQTMGRFILFYFNYFLNISVVCSPHSCIIISCFWKQQSCFWAVLLASSFLPR